MDASINFYEKIRHVERLLHKQEYTDSATRCVLVIEQAFRHIARLYAEQVDEDTRRRVQNAVRKRSRQSGDIDRLTMGQLAHVFRETNFFEAVARYLGKDSSSFAIVDIEKLTALRNKFAHHDQQASSTEAAFLLECLRVLLETFELIDPATHLPPSGTIIGMEPDTQGGFSMFDRFDHGYALLIGVGTTVHYPRWSLPVTIKDVQAIHKILIDPALCAYPDDDQHVRVLHDEGAAGEAILENLAWLSLRAAQDPEATVIVYYSGHGCVDSDTGHYYLIPGDIDPVDFTGSALSAENFSVALHNIAARRLLVFIDSCHAEGMAASKEGREFKLPQGFEKSALPENLVVKLKQGRGRAVFSSSSGDQSSWVRPDGTMSIYTYHLIEALKGAGNRPGETVVSVSNIMNHLGRTVEQSARMLCHASQSPFFDTATEDFPVSMLLGGKGLPAGGWEEVQGESAAKENASTQTTIRQTAGDNARQFGQVHGNVTIQG